MLITPKSLIGAESTKVRTPAFSAISTIWENSMANSIFPLTTAEITGSGLISIGYYLMVFVDKLWRDFCVEVCNPWILLFFNSKN